MNLKQGMVTHHYHYHGRGCPGVRRLLGVQSDLTLVHRCCRVLGEDAYGPDAAVPVSSRNHLQRNASNFIDPEDDFGLPGYGPSVGQAQDLQGDGSGGVTEVLKFRERVATIVGDEPRAMPTQIEVVDDGDTQWQSNLRLSTAISLSQFDV